MPDALRLFLATGVSALLALTLWFYQGGALVVPRGVIITDGILSFLSLVCLRMGMRLYRCWIQEKNISSPRMRRRTAIAGAGDSGAMICRDIQNRPGLNLEIVCFIDDDRGKIGSSIHGRPVVGPLANIGQIAQRTSLKKVIIAMPSAPPAVIRDLVRKLNELGLEHEILPSVTQILHRKVTITNLRRVNPEDLLGRKPVPLNHDGISQLVKGIPVLVTGAGGSIGSELCRQLAEREPSRLVLVERSEPALFLIEQEMKKSFPGVPLVCLAHDVRDEPCIRAMLKEYSPALVFHAAAHKHVPLMEAQPAEAVSNNTLGTEVLCRLAVEAGVRRFIFVSTDKAVNPTSVMGASKRLAELVIEEYHRNHFPKCRFSAVRFGNVLGSSGSVIPTFQRQIADGGPLTVTHPEVTRYFMSIPEAVGLILQCAWQAEGGERFVLDMGSPIRISGLAKQVIELSGFVPERDIGITYVGLRPGEKLYEEPIHQMENVKPTKHPKIHCLQPSSREATVTVSISDLLQKRCDSLARLHPQEIIAWMQGLIPEYQPNGVPAQSTSLTKGIR